MRRWIIGLVFVVCGVTVATLPACQPLTPEQQEKVDEAEADFNEAHAAVETIAETMKQNVAEYEAIKQRIDLGESLPAAVISRYAQLRDLIRKNAEDVKVAVARFRDAKQSFDDAKAAGVPWYQVILQPVLGIAAGVAGTYFPFLRPVLLAAQSMAIGVRNYTRANPDEGKEVKKAIAKASDVSPKTVAMVHRIAQKVDPHP